jgi:hypothetical protein
MRKKFMMKAKDGKSVNNLKRYKNLQVIIHERPKRLKGAISEKENI